MSENKNKESGFADRILGSLISSEDINQNDWLEVLNTWGDQVNWNNFILKKSGTPTDETLISKWIEQKIPLVAIKWLTEKYNNVDFWTNNVDFRSYTADFIKSTFNRSFNTDFTNSACHFFKFVGDEKVNEAAAKSLFVYNQLGSISLSSSLNIKLLDTLNTPIFVPSLLTRMPNPGKALESWLSDNPECINFIDDRMSTALICATSDECVSAYLAAGGSIFDKINKTGMPLWLYSTTKITGAKLNDAMVRAVMLIDEGCLETPPEGIYEDDFKKIIENHKKIKSLIDRASFEKNFLSVGHEYIKKNNYWKTWRGQNSENSMHTLLAMDLRAAISKFKYKKEFSMMLANDDKGRSLPFYFAIGAMSSLRIPSKSSHLSWSAENKMKNKHSDKCSKEITPEIIAAVKKQCENSSVILQLATAEITDASGFASLLDKESGKIQFHNKVLKIFDNDAILNHLKTDIPELMKMPFNKTKRICSFLSNIVSNKIYASINNASGDYNAAITDLMNSLPVKERLGFGLIIISSSSCIDNGSYLSEPFIKSIKACFDEEQSLYLSKNEAEWIEGMAKSSVIAKRHGIDESCNSLISKSSMLDLVEDAGLNNGQSSKKRLM